MDNNTVTQSTPPVPPRDLIAAERSSRPRGIRDDRQALLSDALGTALDEIDRLRGIIAKADADAQDATMDLDKGHSEYVHGMNDQAANTLAILAEAAQATAVECPYCIERARLDVTYNVDNGPCPLHTPKDTQSWT